MAVNANGGGGSGGGCINRLSVMWSDRVRQRMEGQERESASGIEWDRHHHPRTHAHRNTHTSTITHGHTNRKHTTRRTLAEEPEEEPTSESTTSSFLLRLSVQQSARSLLDTWSGCSMFLKGEDHGLGRDAGEPRSVVKETQSERYAEETE